MSQAMKRAEAASAEARAMRAPERRPLSPRPWRMTRESLRPNERAAAGWDRMLKRILGFEQPRSLRTASPSSEGDVPPPALALAPAPAPQPVPLPLPPAAAVAASVVAPASVAAPAQHSVAFPLPTTEEDDPAKQMKKLSRDWILVALNAPNAMQQIVAQFRLIVEGFWPFNNPLLMNVPHPDIMHVIAEEMQTILIKCEAKTLGYPSVAAQPHSLPHFCNFLMLLGHLISEFVTLPYQVPDFFMDIAFRSCVLCLQPPLQWQLAQALVRFWRMVGQEMESRVPEFSELVDGMRDAVLFAERAHTAGDDDGPDPKALLIEALELRARGWRKATKSGEGDGGASSGDPACVSALSEALARASLRVDSFGAAGDCGPRVASAHAI